MVLIDRFLLLNPNSSYLHRQLVPVDVAILNSLKTKINEIKKCCNDLDETPFCFFFF